MKYMYKIGLYNKTETSDFKKMCGILTKRE